MSHSTNQSLKAIVDQIFAERRISRQVQRDLMEVLLSQPTLSNQDHATAQRVFDAIRQGRLRIID
ncbi:hypothetical protein IQ273_27550 [Nodosilinea sp. LEGE 07298]|jgi:hypothetical protein|uniref:hypothetical protein n=1 Tax=Nodosilinea sp. LEGE 07298 TaxID=2777970 RepID=UPI0018802641|nr:hypothetical protein [Nodosilinea sp. LEGE 07298]MBE9113141.1 hypothetical protein [Nodosilinea sp. LEGE 07298]